MDIKKEITADQLGRGNTIGHPETSEWVKTTEVLVVQTGTGRIVHVTLESGEQLELDGEVKLIRRE